MSAHKCEAGVRSGYWSVACGKNAAYEHEGRWYCKTHHPPNVKAKQDARDAKWEADWKSRREAANEADSAKLEVYRRADCYPDLLAALKECAAVCAGETMNKNGLIRALEMSRAAIAKATGVQT